MSIALHTTAGEGDYESDKLATLRTVGSAFEPLIYGLKGDITYEIFCEKCRSVWDELRKNPKLPQMLVCIIIVCQVEINVITASMEGRIDKWGDLLARDFCMEVYHCRFLYIFREHAMMS